MEMLEMYSRVGNMAALAECHDFLPQMWNKNTVAAKCFKLIFTDDGFNFALMCRRACEYEPLLQFIPLNLA